MSNTYYNNSSDLVPGTKARAEDINSRMAAVEDGFDKLPAAHASAPGTKGFSEVFKIVDATATDHPASAKQVRDGSLCYALDTGIADAYVATLSTVPSAYSTGMEIKLKIVNTNTGASTINVNSLGAKSIKRLTGEALSGGDLTAGRVAGLRYDGTNFVLIDGMYAVHGHNDLYYPKADTYSADEVDAIESALTSSIAGKEPALGNPSAQGQLLQSSIGGVRSWVYGVPTGAIIDFPTGTVPGGFLECNGAAISRTTYASLFNVIGDFYGPGNGTTTFNIPDRRGYFPRGWAHGTSVDPDKATRTDRGDGTTGDYVGTKQADGFKTHTHDINTAYGTSDALMVRGGSGTSAAISTAAARATGGNETRPVNVNTMYCIKYMFAFIFSCEIFATCIQNTSLLT